MTAADKHLGILPCTLFCLASFLVWGCTLSTSAHARPYEFSDDDFLAPAVEMIAWAETLERHESEREALYGCVAANSCRGRLRSFDRVMTEARSVSDEASLTREEKLQLAQYYINRGKYRDDRLKRIYDEDGRKIGIQRSHWATLRDVLVKGGDCEDYATAKYFMLRELGVPADDLRIVIAYERKLGGYHAVLAARLNDEETWLLDSDNRIRKKRHTGYRYIYAMNEHSVWDHEQTTSPKRTKIVTSVTGEAD